MKGWDKLKLKDICEFKYGKNLPEHSREKGPYPVYGSSGIVSYHKEFLKKGPGIIVGRKGTVGKVQYSKGAFFPIDTTYFIEEKKSKVDLLFLYYMLPIYNLDTMNSDAAVPGLNREAAINVRILLPPLPTQRRIASILSAYDDLIENNLKRVKLLEELAQRTYEEWFVKFRINGEQLPIDDKTGLPVGWERKKITECYSFKQFKEKVKKFDGDIVYLATADVDGSQITGTGEVVNWENKPSRAQIKLIKESVWFARMSNTYKVILTTSNFKKEFIISSGFAGFIAKNSNCLPFLFCLINSKEFHDKKDLFATGATQVSLNDISLSSIEIVEPTKIIIEEFGKSFLNNLELRQNLIDQNQSLKNSRDILLPKLMSGKINIA
jgi:type I restriction enzyme S subunit